MKLFTRDADGKPDTPLSIWVGLGFILLAVVLKTARIGPGEAGFSWELGFHTFLILTGLVVLLPGLFLTLMRRPE